MLSENFGEHHIWWLTQSFFPNIAMQIYAKSHWFSDEKPFVRLFGHRIFQTLSKTVVGLLPGRWTRFLCSPLQRKNTQEGFGELFIFRLNLRWCQFFGRWCVCFRLPLHMINLQLQFLRCLLRNIHILMSKRILLAQLTIVYCVEYKHIYIYINSPLISTGAIYYIYIYKPESINLRRHIFHERVPDASRGTLHEASARNNSWCEGNATINKCG